MKREIIFILFILNLIFVGNIYAETAYINETTVNVRTGPGTEFDALKIVKYGDKITIIGEQEGWYKVRLEDGKEGWVSKKTIREEPPVQIVIEDLQSKIISQEKEAELLRKENEELKGLKASLSSRIEDIEKRRSLLDKENKRLKEYNNIIWAIIGIAILIIGWLMGFLFGHFKREAKRVTIRDRKREVDREIQNLLKEKSAVEKEGTFSDSQLKEKEELLKNYDEQIKALRAERGNL
ncbi:MAG: TIGR04211 family SH3 domain-containing protein [Nitrospinae bacterium]|nr:TIGR04211 family SH3 domain-containing protein [Nitrospinota bacterium]